MFISIGCKQLAAVASRPGSAPGHSCINLLPHVVVLVVDARLNIKTYINHASITQTNKYLLSPIL
jgi:hypothetical protein